jgi:hypothetical protein
MKLTNSTILIAASPLESITMNLSKIQRTVVESRPR